MLQYNQVIDMLKTSKDICTELNIDRTTLYRWMKNDNFPKYRIGGTWRFELDKVMKWAENFGKKYDG